MGFLELDVTLTDEAKAMAETAEKFGMKAARALSRNVSAYNRCGHDRLWHEPIDSREMMPEGCDS